MNVRAAQVRSVGGAHVLDRPSAQADAQAVKRLSQYETLVITRDGVPPGWLGVVEGGVVIGHVQAWRVAVGPAAIEVTP